MHFRENAAPAFRRLFRPSLLFEPSGQRSDHMGSDLSTESTLPHWGKKIQDAMWVLGKNIHERKQNKT